MITVDTAIQRSLRLDEPLDVAWAFLVDVPRWGVLYPHVESVRPLPEAGPDAYVWTMEPLGPPGGRVVITYACRYHADAEARTLTWEPVPGVGNARFGGACTVVPDGDGATVGTLRLDAELDISVPRWLRGIVRPTVEFEMGRMTDLFVRRIEGAVGV